MDGAPKYTDSKEKLIDVMRKTTGTGSRHFDIAKAILDVRGQEEVAKQTKSLKWATWALVGATIALVFATIVSTYSPFRYKEIPLQSMKSSSPHK
jgi:hypothetical protein